VAGLDGYLPAAFGKLHPRFKTPWVSVLGQGLFGIFFVFLGQVGVSVGGAYNVLVAISVSIAMIPFLFLFASMVRLQKRSHFPSGHNAATDIGPFAKLPSGIGYALGVVGFLAASVATALSFVPPVEEPNKLLYLWKLLGTAAVLMGMGLLLFHSGRRSTK